MLGRGGARQVRAQSVLLNLFLMCWNGLHMWILVGILPDVTTYAPGSAPGARFPAGPALSLTRPTPPPACGVQL